MVLQKTCTTCKIEKRLDAFSKSKLGRFGVGATCKICKRAYDQIHKEKANYRERQKRKINFKFRLNCRISAVIRRSLKGEKAGRHWEYLVGYTLNDLRKHLEKHFVEGMTWENQGNWHIDHKIPKSAFNFTKPEHKDFKNCWALKNLQPMWAKDNILKSSKIKKHFQPSLLL
jgi:hypothetical protein